MNTTKDLLIFCRDWAAGSSESPFFYTRPLVTHPSRPLVGKIIPILQDEETETACPRLYGWLLLD